ncbi:hypothetical protein L210DRAFT_3526813 [Boletus edulis BED1]|uniref:Voltage-gated hydrogen channel 1 n=1 Tax=Boletus edulis BED1 TaxID=1328754 RepID=A0AAD4C359_BOLED|nr:hypothetical protein L210DRAFT_3526813 [Boletus edulis BED1]
MASQDAPERQPLLPITCDNSEARANSTLLTWRGNVASVLESRRLHTFVLTLVVIDAACVITDIAYGFLVDGCPGPLTENPAWLEVLANISLAITTFFLIEIPLALWAFGYKFYLPYCGVPLAHLHLFDAIIIITTFVLEFVLKGRERELVGLLVILRLWRLVKLVGGLAVGAGEVEEELIEELEQTKRQLEGSIAALAKAREENRKLRARVVWLETGGSEGSEL